MSDLISRQTVLDILQEEKSLRCGYDADIAILSIEKKIKEQPTAYDVEKVVAELEELDDKDTREVYMSHHVALDNVIEVVRKGGV